MVEVSDNDWVVTGPGVTDPGSAAPAVSTSPAASPRPGGATAAPPAADNDDWTVEAPPSAITFGNTLRAAVGQGALLGWGDEAWATVRHLRGEDYDTALADERTGQLGARLAEIAESGKYHTSGQAQDTSAIVDLTPGTQRLGRTVATVSQEANTQAKRFLQTKMAAPVSGSRARRRRGKRGADHARHHADHQRVPRRRRGSFRRNPRGCAGGPIGALSCNTSSSRADGRWAWPTSSSAFDEGVSGPVEHNQRKSNQAARGSPTVAASW
jgi:hypothetical protein